MSKLSNSSLALSQQHPFAKTAVVVALAAVVLSAIVSTGIIYFYNIYPGAGYGLIASNAIIAGVLAGICSEIFDTKSRQLKLAQAETSELQIKFEHEIRQAHAQIDRARLDKIQIEAIVVALAKH
jgi:hypothetical protein